MRSILNKKGSAVITAIGMGIVLLIIIAGVHLFSSYRAQTIILESKKVKALGLAEAGMEVALGELFNNTNFVTHKVSKELEWQEEMDRENTIAENSVHGFAIDSGTRGTISGKLGDGTFKVRVGNIPYKDNENTRAIDESKSYAKIEALGIYDGIVRRIIAVVNRRFPAREFLMYDGGVLSMIYGQTGKSNWNVFSTGHLYGHEGIEIGQVTNSAHKNPNPGTTQKLDNINAILSGAGGIFVYSPIEAKFGNKSGAVLNTEIPKNCTYPLNGTYANPELEEFGQFPNELKDTLPTIPDNLTAWIKDKTSGISIPPRTPSFEQYKKEAQSKGLYFAANASGKNCESYRMPQNWTADGANKLDVVYLDFGNNIHDSQVDFPENGIIFAEKDIVIKGNPPKDVSIVSTKNVFVAGDFNQAGDKSVLKERYGFPQDYNSGMNALNSDNYCQTSQDLFRADADPSTTFKHHIAATVVAKERVVYDYRSPVDCFENEIVPYLKYELAKAISVEGGQADACLSPDNIQSLTVTASSSIDGFNQGLASFTAKFPLGDDGSKNGSIADLLKNKYEETNGSFNYQSLDDMTIDVWKAYVDDYSGGMKGEVSSAASNRNHGVYQLLFELRKQMGFTDANNNGIDVSNVASIKDLPDDYIYFPEITANAMFISCGKQNNTNYAGPDVQKMYNEIGYSSKTSDVVKVKHSPTTGFVHRVFGSETNLRLYDVHQLPKSKNDYVPPTRKKIYDDTLPQLGDGGNNQLEFTGYVVLSWQDLGATEADYQAF